MDLKTSIKCVLFDLDGTLIDTAPDFIRVLDRLMLENDKPKIDPELIYQTVSDGAGALIKLAFAIDETNQNFAGLHRRFLDLYGEQIKTTEALLYKGLNELLKELKHHDIRWGIVTNKPALYATCLLEKLSLDQRCEVLICPDHVKNRKPHPESILLGCETLGCDAGKTVYIGDHQRDMEAAKNANVIAIAAAYGYLNAESKIEQWQADFIVQHSEEIKPLLNSLTFI